MGSTSHPSKRWSGTGADVSLKILPGMQVGQPGSPLSKGMPSEGHAAVSEGNSVFPLMGMTV